MWNMQHKHGEQWRLMNIEVRNAFERSATIMINCIPWINHYGKRIRIMDENDRTTVCPMSGENEDWDHTVSCKNNKDNWEEWGKGVEMKIKT